MDNTIQQPDNDFQRLDPRDLRAISAGDPDALRWASVPVLTRSYLEGTSDEELLALSILLLHRAVHGGAVREDAAAKLKKVNRAMEAR